MKDYDLHSALSSGDAAGILRNMEELSLQYFDERDENGDLGSASIDQIRDMLVEETIGLLSLKSGKNRADLLPETEGTLHASLKLLKKLQAATRERVYDPRIELVHVFSGAGTYFKENNGEDVHRRWTDRDAIRGAIAVMRGITAAKEAEGTTTTKAPLLFYDGIPEQNNVLREVQQSRPDFPPLYIGDTVREDNGTLRPIIHTGDQARDAMQRLLDPASPLYGRNNISLVGHLVHFIRLPFYEQKELGNRPNFKLWAYPIQPRRGSPTSGIGDTVPNAIATELLRLATYLQKGNLAAKPCTFENVD